MHRAMHIIILTQYYPPEMGAPQSRLSELTRRYTSLGYKVTILTAMPNYPVGKIYEGYGGFFRREERDGAEIIRTFIYPTQKADFFNRLSNYFSFVISSAIVGSFVLRKSDYLLVQSPPLFLGISGYWLSRLKRTRMIFNVSDLWPETAVRIGVLRENSLFHRASAWLEAFLYRKAWLVTCQAQSILDNIVERYPNTRTYRLSNGVDTNWFTPEMADSRIRASLSSPNQCIVSYIGLHGLPQGLDQVLEAADILRDRQDIHFVLVGDGPKKAELVEQAKALALGNVDFYDAKPKAEIPALIASTDISLVPIKTYIPGMVPSKLYEAMSSARPVILVAEGEAADIVRNANAGIIVKPGDVQGLVDAIVTLSSQPELRAELGRNGRKAAIELFDRDDIARKFIEFLETAN